MALDRKMRQLEAISSIRLQSVQLKGDKVKLEERVKELKSDQQAGGAAEGVTSFDVVDPMVHQQRVGALVAFPPSIIENLRQRVPIIEKDLAKSLSSTAVTEILDAVQSTSSPQSLAFAKADLALTNAERVLALHQRLEAVHGRYHGLVSYSNAQVKAWSLRMQLEKNNRQE